MHRSDKSTALLLTTKYTPAAPTFVNTAQLFGSAYAS
jgi:hypothetical protein